MKRRYASVDAFVQVFDDKISKYLDKNRKAIELEYKEKAGAPVQDAEIQSFLQGLGDAIYEQIQLDPAQLERFANFYVGDDKMQKMVSSAVDSSNAFPRAAGDYSSPGEIANQLRLVASHIAAQGNKVTKADVAVAVKKVLKNLDES